MNYQNTEPAAKAIIREYYSPLEEPLPALYPDLKQEIPIINIDKATPINNLYSCICMVCNNVWVKDIMKGLMILFIWYYLLPLLQSYQEI